MILAIAVALADQALLGILRFFALFEADSSSRPSHFVTSAYEIATFVLAPLVLLGRRERWVNLEPLMTVLSGVLWESDFMSSQLRAPRDIARARKRSISGIE